MAIKEDIEKGNNGVHEEVREPLMASNLADGNDGCGSAQNSSKGSAWMVYLSTFVAVCGSFEFGSCVSNLFSL